MNMYKSFPASSLAPGDHDRARVTRAFLLQPQTGQQVKFRPEEDPPKSRLASALWAHLPSEGRVGLWLGIVSWDGSL